MRVVDRHAELGRDHDLVASRAERAPEELLGLGRAVDVRGVEEVDPGVEGRRHDGVGAGLVKASAEVVAPDADDGHLQ